MKVLGIVAEYNPFHNGHMYHIEQSKKLTGCDYVVCVMSGNFIQRGEPAIINKFARTEIALNSGVDLVVELPVPFSMSSAEYFAFGAVKLLDSLGIVDCISFGSEHGEVNELLSIAKLLCEEPEEFKQYLTAELKAGLSFPAARQNAIEQYFSDKALQESIHELLSSSNNILGVEYLKALIRLNSKIKPYTVKRVSNAYNEKHLTGSISSATAIRRSIMSCDSSIASTNKVKPRASEATEACFQYASDVPATGSQWASVFPDAGSQYATYFPKDCSQYSFVGTEACAQYASAVPQIACQVLEREFAAGRGPVSMEDFELIILSMLRSMNTQIIAKLPGISEGLEYRLKSAALEAGSINELLDLASTKRYTRTRLQRTIMSLLSGLTQQDLNEFMVYGGPQYARILGFNNNGKELLSKAKRNSCIPIITKTKDALRTCNPLLKKMLEIENVATNNYVLAYKDSALRKSGQEYTSKLVIVQNQ